MAEPGRRVSLEGPTLSGLTLSSLAVTMRHLFICTLPGILLISGLIQTTHSLPQTRQHETSNRSRKLTVQQDLANRLMADDPKVRASARAALVAGAGRSLPLLRRFLNH